MADKRRRVQRKLTQKQARFCEILFKTDDGTKAYKESYDASRMSRSAIYSAVSQLKTHPLVQRRLEFLDAERKRAHQKLAREQGVTEEAIIAELARIGFTDPASVLNEDGSYKAIHDMPEDVRRAIKSWRMDKNGVVRDVQFYDKHAALRALGDSMALFKQVHEHRHSVRDMTDEELEAELAQQIQAAQAVAGQAKAHGVKLDS